MKFCTKCGNQLVDEAIICPKCGCATERFYAQKKANKKLSDLASFFLVFTTAFWGICVLFVSWISAFAIFPFILSLACLLIYTGKINKKQSIPTSFKILTLLSGNIIAGIIMLCDK